MSRWLTKTKTGRGTRGSRQLVLFPFPSALKLERLDLAFFEGGSFNSNHSPERLKPHQAHPWPFGPRISQPTHEAPASTISRKWPPSSPSACTGFLFTGVRQHSLPPATNQTCTWGLRTTSATHSHSPLGHMAPEARPCRPCPARSASASRQASRQPGATKRLFQSCFTPCVGSPPMRPSVMDFGMDKQDEASTTSKWANLSSRSQSMGPQIQSSTPSHPSRPSGTQAMPPGGSAWPKLPAPG